MKSVAVSGLGKMGTAIAHNILKAKFDLIVYNRTREKTEPLEKWGAKVAGSPRDAVKDADIVISMVADDIASRNIWLGESGGLDGAKQGTVLLECSTLSLA